MEITFCPHSVPLNKKVRQGNEQSYLGLLKPKVKQFSAINEFFKEGIFLTTIRYVDTIILITFYIKYV